MSAEGDDKTLGTAAFKAQDYAKAIEHYSSAIGEDKTDKTLFSNRSAAYSKQGEFKNALLDANKCIDLEPTWARGHSRRGAAYVGLRNWPSALKAYEKALEHDPENAHAKSEVASIKARLAGGSAASATGQPTMGAGMGGGMPNAGPVPGANGSTLSHLAVLVCTLMYFVPILGPRRAQLGYRVALGANLSSYLLTLWRGWPHTFATLKDARFQQAPEVSFVLLSFMMVMSPPLPFALVPLACYAAHHVCSKHSAIIAKLPAFMRSRAQWMVSNEGTQMVLAFAAISEVMVGFTMPFIVFAQGMRVFAVCALYLQFLFKRHQTSWWTQTAVHALNDKANSVFRHKYCPSPVGMLFDRFKGAVAMAASYLAPKA